MIIFATSDNGLEKRWGDGVGSEGTNLTLPNRDALNLHADSSNDEDIVLLDLSLSGLNGFEDVSAFVERYPRLRFVVMSSSPNDHEAYNYIKSGVWGYCNRYIAPDLLSTVVSTVKDGEVWAGRKLMLRLIEELRENENTQSRDQINSKLAVLSDRERQIANLVSGGASNKIIASQLDITERTVKAHLSSIFKKLSLKDRLQLALFVKGQL
jgi:two-component system nitrate/nitrite response regulator NarL